jgi:hypothetical protein
MFNNLGLSAKNGAEVSILLSITPPLYGLTAPEDI